MRKYLTLTAVLLDGSLLTLVSCKRGENDPAISLVSRTNRLVGSWELTQKQGSMVTNTTAGSTTSSVSLTSNYTSAQGGLEQIMVAQNSNAPVLSNFLYKFTIDFEKTGDCKYEAAFYTPVNNSTALAQVYKGTANWNWLDKGKDKVALQITEVGNAGSQLDTLNANTLLPYSISNEYYLDRLSSKDMIWKVFANDITSIDTITVANTADFTFTFTKK